MLRRGTYKKRFFPDETVRNNFMNGVALIPLNMTNNHCSDDTNA